MSQSAPLSWTYEGKNKSSDDEFANVSNATPGELLRHDVFDLCELIGAGDSAGMLKVKVLEDGIVYDLTSGHFQELSGKEKTAQQVRPGPGTNNDKTAGDQQGNTGASDTASAGAQPGDDLKATAGNGEAGSNAGQEPGPTEATAANDSAGGNDAGDGNPVPEEEANNNDTTNKDAASALFSQVVESMQAQSDEFKLDAEGADLVFYKRLVLLDTRAVNAASKTESLCVSNIIRERSTGHFFSVARIYKPLFGWLAEATGLAVDPDGAEQTPILEAGARMLGASTSFFSSERDALLVVLYKPKYKHLWMCVRLSTLAAQFDLNPDEADIVDDLGSDWKSVASMASSAWTAEAHVNLIGKYPGGGTEIEESALKSDLNVAAYFKRRRTKMHSTPAEKAAAAIEAHKAKAAKAEAAATAAAARAAAQAAARARSTRPPATLGGGRGGGRGGRGGGRGATPHSRLTLLDDDVSSDSNDEDEDEAQEIKPPHNNYTRKRPAADPQPDLPQPEPTRQSSRPPTAQAVRQPRPPANVPANINAALAAARPVENRHYNSGAHPRFDEPGFQSSEADEQHEHHGVSRQPLATAREGQDRRALSNMARPQSVPQYYYEDECENFNDNMQRFDDREYERPRDGQRGGQRGGQHDGWYERRQQQRAPLRAEHGLDPYYSSGELERSRHSQRARHVYCNDGYNQRPQPMSVASPGGIPLAAFAAKAAYEAQVKEQALAAHAKYMYFCNKFPRMMRDEFEEDASC